MLGCRCVLGKAGTARLLMSVRRISVQHGTGAELSARASADDVHLVSSVAAKHSLRQRALSAVNTATGWLSVFANPQI